MRGANLKLIISVYMDEDEEEDEEEDEGEESED